MQEITALKYKSGSKVILYSKFEMMTDDIEKKVERIIGDNELERLMKMPVSDVAEVVDNILSGRGIFND